MIPSSNTTMEPEAIRILNYIANVHTSRIRLREVTIEALDEMIKDVDREASKLADADVEVILYGCTSGSFFKGLGFDKQIEKRIEEVSGIKTISTSRAVLDALRNLHMKRIAVATPYIDEVNREEARFLTANGFSITNFKSLGLKANLDIGRVDPSRVFELVQSMKKHIEDGVFISCTNLATIDLIERLERKLNKPVVSSNLASFWAVSKAVGAFEKIEGYGSLLRTVGKTREQLRA